MGGADISCEQRDAWYECLAAVALVGLTFGGLLFLGAISVLQFIGNLDPDQTTRTTLFLGSVIVASVGTILWLWRENYRKYWKLTDTALVGGRREAIRIPLDAVEKVIVGLPEDVGILSRMNKVVNPRLAHAVKTARASTIVLKLKDDSLIPFYVLNFENGGQLTNELLKRLERLIDSQYEFSESEIRAMRRPNWTGVSKFTNG